MLSRAREIALGLGTLIIGAVIGAIVERGINNGLGASMLALLVTTIALFSGTVIWASSAKEQASRIDVIGGLLRDVKKRLGLQVVLQELRTIGDPRLLKEDRLGTLIQQVEFEILEVNRSEVHAPPYNPEFRSEAISLRKAYYDGLLARVATQGERRGSFTYKRIEQFESEEGTFSSSQDVVYVDHLRHMIEMQRDTGLNIYVKKALLTFPISFLILDREYLVITFDGVSRIDGKNWFFQKSELIIQDPQHELVNVFLREWDRIENAPTTRTASLSDF